MKRLWPAVVCTLLFFVAGSLPAGPSGGPQWGDKVLHFVGFGLLAGLWCGAIHELRLAAGWLRIALLGFVISSALGGVLELWQGLLGYRSRELLDWIADMLGALVVSAAWAAWQARGRARAAST